MIQKMDPVLSTISVSVSLSGPFHSSVLLPIFLICRRPCLCSLNVLQINIIHPNQSSLCKSVTRDHRTDPRGETRLIPAVSVTSCIWSVTGRSSGVCSCINQTICNKNVKFDSRVKLLRLHILVLFVLVVFFCWIFSWLDIVKLRLQTSHLCLY